MKAQADKRETARLRSERWRRAHGIMPRQPAKRPWLALGIGRSTYYRRRKRAQEARAAILRETAIAQAANLAGRLRADLDRCAALDCEVAAILRELTAFTANESHSGTTF
jgi:hypothetical protein